MITGMPRIAIAVRDFDAVVATFRDRFGMPVIDLSGSTVTSLGAKLAMCVPPGGSNIELMCPADPGMPLSQSLDGFLARRGEGLFALMLEAPDPNAEAERLLASRLNVLPLMAGAGGRDIHPKSTHGVLIRIYPTGSFQGSQAPGNSDLGLSGILRVMIAVKDIDAAIEVYGAKLGLSVGTVTDDPARGTRSAMVHPPASGAIELVTPRDGARPGAALLDRHLRARGEGLFALVLSSADPARTGKVLAERGVEVTSSREGAVDIASSSVFGARIRIETADEGH